MADERPEPQPLEYLSGRTHRAFPRGLIVAGLGAAVALGGMVVFICAHSLADSIRYNHEHRMFHELLWAAFGIALLLAGTIIAAVGLKSWCGRGGG